MTTEIDKEHHDTSDFFREKPKEWVARNLRTQGRSDVLGWINAQDREADAVMWRAMAKPVTADAMTRWAQAGHARLWLRRAKAAVELWVKNKKPYRVSKWRRKRVGLLAREVTAYHATQPYVSSTVARESEAA